ncbi:SDR family oxidoreductase [Neobacillus cucumis]|uniref:SDR family NAD(P)-dependent oxidoreductase n=1 Tax=Neobacillus cucumis TaxID=1740721 RepID=UPI00203EFA95|nr:SDR family NAD(P)-dependent oxidoreductase [Neobacillus cucumis]MCM3729861.1 SDR family oxidoreductase [Neobacillus cucumis]
MEFQDKVVIITGAAGNIGKEAARQFSSEGAKLTLVDLNEETLQNTAAELNLKEGNYIIAPTDVTKENQVENYVKQTVEKFGKIDVFFNNAGFQGKMAPLTELAATDFNAVINVNVNGVFYGLKHVLKVMNEQKSGSIINSASVSGLTAAPMQTAYVTSKHAVLGLTKMAALENAINNVRVNAICPSPVDSAMMRRIEEGMNPEDAKAVREAIAKLIPAGRYVTIEEVVNLVVFLASDKSTFINGAAYTIDGGYTIQ